MQRRLRSCLTVIYVVALIAHGVVVSYAQQAPTVAASEPDAAKPTQFSDQQLAFFETEIRPLLATHCAKCHGAARQQGGLRLDSRAGVIAGGDLGPAATPGDAADSRLIEYVEYAGDTKMPPAGKLADRQIAALRRWVAEGLPWPVGEAVAPGADAADKSQAERTRPWSFAPVVDHALPQVARADWCRNEIDRFVLAHLEAAGLQPAPQADKRTLLRRVKFDLLGLPPTPEEVDAFLADHAPDALARWIDRFLAAPEYGQRWGRHWLDVARYADSNGQDENLAYVSAFRYRDYVVDAFNNDKPYDEFIREQIAGDLLPATTDAARFEHLVATGFLTLGPKMLAEDDPVKMEMDIIDEQVDTLGGAFLGLTLGCARCHDHKFDPISTADYYALAGIFKSTQTMDNFKVVAKWHERPLASAVELATIAAHEKQLSDKKAELAAHVERANQSLVRTARQRMAEYILAATELLDAPELVSLVQSTTGKVATDLPSETLIREAEDFDRGNVLVDTANYGTGIGIILNRGELPNYAEYDLQIPRNGLYQLELRYAAAEPRSVSVLVDGRVQKAGAAGEATGSWHPDTQSWHAECVVKLAAGKVVLRIERRDGPFPHFDAIALVPREVHVPGTTLLSPDELARERDLNPGFLARWISYLKGAREDEKSPWQLWFAFRPGEPPVRESFIGVGREAAARILAAGIPASREELAGRYANEIVAADARVKETVTAQTPADSFDHALSSVLSDPRGPLRVPEKSKSFYPAADGEQFAKLERELQAIKDAAPVEPPQAMAVEEGKPTDLKIHIRGSHLTLGEESPRRFPTALTAAMPTLPPGASGRLQLADWIASPDHPLTSRVMVNRVWRWHFGAGLVRSTDNFGNLGARPSHPELLDWLARRFVESGWSIKSLHRLILQSATYQMAVVDNPAAAQADPDNRLLWRGNRRRLEAEAVRDALLAVGGSLDTARGGTLLTAKPRAYVTGTASVNSTVYTTNRRSIYLPVVRSALYDAFQAFDFAEPTALHGDRDTTSIASQALFMMNSGVMNEQSAKLAERIAAEHADDRAGRVDLLYRIALARSASAAETARALAFVDRYSQSVGGEEVNKRESTAWQALCRVILSANEFLYVD